MPSSRIIPIAAMEALMKKAGAPRVSEKSKAKLKGILEEIGHKLTLDALIYSKHGKRKTIRPRDLELAKEKLKF